MIKKKQTFSKIIIISFIITLTLFRSIYAFAITLPEDKGEINIFIEGLILTNPINIKMKLYRIKELTDEKEGNLLTTENTEDSEVLNSNALNFKFTEEFKDIADIDKRLNEDSEEYVQEIKKFATDNKIQCIEADVDYLTHALFKDLELGKYLVVIDDFIMDDKLFECNSFIVTIPMMQNGEYVFSITANPKFSEIIINPPDDTNNVNNTTANPDTNVITNSAEDNNLENKPNEERKRLPDTGLPIVSVIVLSILGLICIIVGCILDKRTKKK